MLALALLAIKKTPQVDDADDDLADFDELDDEYVVPEV